MHLVLASVRLVGCHSASVPGIVVQPVHADLAAHQRLWHDAGCHVQPAANRAAGLASIHMAGSQLAWRTSLH